MQADQKTTLADLKQVVKHFVAERQWEKFHSPKNISMALAIEAGELMEHFQWITQKESLQPDDEKRVKISEEMSDILCYLVAMANTLDIDLADAFDRKMDLNRQKYPASEYRGRYGAEDPSPVSSS